MNKQEEQGQKSIGTYNTCKGGRTNSDQKFQADELYNFVAIIADHSYIISTCSSECVKIQKPYDNVLSVPRLESYTLACIRLHQYALCMFNTHDGKQHNYTTH